MYCGKWFAVDFIPPFSHTKRRLTISLHWASFSVDLNELCGAYIHDSAKDFFPTLESISTISSAFPVAYLNDLQWASSDLTIYDCLKEFTLRETLEGDNMVYCSQCQSHQAAEKHHSLWGKKLPKILILHLKRFEFRGIDGYGPLRRKLEDFIDFPLESLDLSPFCEGLDKENFSNTYDLFAVCNHFGRLGFGHYTASVRDYVGKTLSPQWYLMDDTNVMKVESADVVNRDAYVLFYRMRE